MNSPYVRRLRLGMELKALRDERNFTQSRVARLAGMTRNEISRLENGRAVDLVHVLNILEALGVEGERYTALYAIAQEAVTPGWWDSIKHIGERQALYANLESGATSIRAYEQTYLPGLLQLPEYIRSIHTAAAALRPPAGPVEGFLAGRAGRQRNLRRPGGPSYDVIVDEIAILRRSAPVSTLKPQLRHLVTIAKGAQPNITVRILPAEAQFRDFELPRTAFSIYAYSDPGDPTVVAVDTVTSDVILTDDIQVTPFDRLYDRIREAALSPEESADLLTKAADMLPDN
jgi:transcriptional regulator with XRE-family HTH domain